MSILRRLSPAEISQHFSRETMLRARSYADGDAIEAPEIGDLTATTVTASAEVWGTDYRPYRVHLRASAYGDVLSLATTCTCPVHFQCKHGAALAFALGSMFETSAPVTWEQRLAELADDLRDLAPPDTDPVPLALQLTWDEGKGHKVFYQTGPLLRLRPMRPGKKGGWIKSGITWTNVPAAVQGQDHAPAQLEVLRALHSALERQGGYWYAGREPTVGDFGPDVVPLLLEAEAAGFPLLLQHLSTLHLVEKPVALGADVHSTDEGPEVVVGLDHEGRLWHGDEVGLWGDPAHTALLDHGDGELSLARLERRLSRGPARVLAAPPLQLPGDAVERLPDELARLRRLLPLGSSDGTVDVPAPVAPRLRLTVRWSGADAATLAWEWVYGERAVGWDADDDVRDRRAERAVVDALPQAPDPARREVSGVDVLHLALLELPAWRACDDIEVVEVDAPDFRETEATPVIGFDAPPPEEQGETDWLDLWVTITVDGEAVPLVAVLAAITLEEEHVVLPSGLFFRTDRPEFARLQALVRAAGELREPEGGRISVGTHDLGLWAQLAELGVVDAQADEWVRRAQALRDLTDIPQPEPTGVVSELRSYQRDGFHWLAFLWQHGLGGILADDMGLGKTLQVLALVAHTRATTDEPFLVVAPTSVVPAWVSEAARHTPGLRVRAITASAARRGESIAEIAADADIVVTSYTLQRLETESYAGVRWAGLVLDEAQQVKNHQSKAYSSVRKVEAPFRLAVTGTPFENRLLELWSLLSIVTPGIYPHPRSFLEHVVRPVEKEGDDKALRRFTHRIKPFVLRRTKEVVAADLPPKQEQTLAVELHPRHRKLYDTHLAKERQRILGLVDDFDHNRVAILAALTKLRQLALDPALVDPAHDTVGSAKLDVLVEHVVELVAEGHRALVFSTFTTFLKRVRDRLEATGVPTVYLDGATTRRGDVVQTWRDGTAPVFLISLKAGGVGLTLTEADYVFVLDPWWNPAAEAQAVDRAHRIGQHQTVMVYRLVSTDTIEDKVMDLKARKAQLFAKVIDGDGATSQSITADDIRALFD
ncbi:DEAD/DEAH box helicase [Nocardioides sp.]|uniref:DEAD/DEAH box helicase n=1 Tax=Nocardioides sp. TaxID=35761 RepID=UPI0027189D3E|nr:DEAD/DEAH box helicase [Nocardioides sp.]MDO9456702.1 DEAD/DEAH box helicase [Nocardioides sp.]